MEVDVQSATVCRYEDGLSTLQTTWRMLTNPWDIEPQPMKGYDIVGTEEQSAHASAPSRSV